MVQEWALCIQVKFYLNPEHVTIEYVMRNNVWNEVIHRKREMHGTTTNNEAYYIALIEWLQTTKMYRSNFIYVYTNFEHICIKIKGIYQVRKRNLKPLCVEERTIATKFQFFMINHHSDINRMYADLLVWEMTTPRGSVKNEMVSTSIVAKFRLAHCYTSLVCVCFFVIIVLVSLMVWIFQ